MSAFILWATILIPLALFFTYRAWRHSKPLVPLLRTSQIPVRELETTSGSVKVAGTAVPADESGTVTAPISGTECLAYRYEIEQKTHGDREGHSENGYRTYYRGRGGTPFLLDDGTGQVVVDPSDADLRFGDIGDHREWFLKNETLPDELPARLESMEAFEATGESFDIWNTELQQDRDQRMTEWRLNVDESVTVYGQCKRDTGGDWGSDRVSARIEGSRGPPEFFISDRDIQETTKRFTRSVLLYLLGTIAIILFLTFLFLRA